MTTRIRAPTNYQNGLIYTMRERGTDNIFYIGSTCSLRRRRNSHKSRCTNINDQYYNMEVYQHIRSVGGWETVILEQLHSFACNNKQELTSEEGRVYKEFVGKGYQLKNNNVPGRTHKQHYQDNKERILERKKQNYQDNKERILERNEQYNKQKVTCGCGSTVRRDSLARHNKSKKHQKWVEQQQ